MPHDISSGAVVVALLTPIAKSLQSHQLTCVEFNDLPNIPWYQRQEMRTIEGHLGKIEESIVALFRRIGSPEAMEAVTELWGPQTMSRAKPQDDPDGL